MQDEVARRLMRTPAGEMHRAMYRYGTQRMASWEKISKEAYTSTFLLLHGWTLNEYIAQCNLGYVSDDHIKVFFLNRMITNIVESFECTVK